MPRPRIQQQLRGVNGFKGMREVQAKLGLILDTATGKKIKDVYMEAGLALRDEIRNRAPRGKTGNLKRGIFADHGDKAKSNVIVGAQYRYRGQAKGAIAPHAHLIEFGHATRGGGFVRARPFFRPAVESMKGRLRQILTSGLKKTLDEAAR